MPTALRHASFWTKVGLAVALVDLADASVFDVDFVGAGLGLLALSFVAATVVAHPPLRRSRFAAVALLTAAAFAALQIERATLLGFLFFAVAMGVAVLSPRARSTDDAWQWSQRLILGALKAIPRPFEDLLTFLKVRARRRMLTSSVILLTVAMPLIGGAVFLSLFAAANPVISNILATLHIPPLDVPRLIFWGVVGGVAWTVLRPRGLRRTRALGGGKTDLDLPGVTTASVTLSLVVFNAIFALQNGLDIAFLWSGAPLPEGVTITEYVHRGAYPLIATALLAGLFVLVFLRPGSATAQARWPRILVIIWVAQNLLLVASTAWRTAEYVDEYLLTRLRTAAFAWMALVAVGLVLICWRMLRARSSSWLVNANVLTAGVVLAAFCFVDLGAVAARWNVTHAREVGGRGQPLDLCYMRRLGGGAVVSLAKLEQRALTPGFRERVAWTRRTMTADLVKRQANWRGWRWRDARRLALVRALAGPDVPVSFSDAGSRDCAGRPLAPPAQLTAPAQPGT